MLECLKNDGVLIKVLKYWNARMLKKCWSADKNAEMLVV